MILNELAAHARKRVAAAEKHRPLEEIRAQALSLPAGNFAFEQALKKPELSVICEIKRASPSKGLIAPEFPYLEIGKTYEAAGADCISVLTEPKWFLGSDQIFKEIRDTVTCPMIRKDFTVDEYQIYEAKQMGADAVLLICSILDTQAIADYLEICDTLGLTALVETHNEAEIRSAIEANARVIGVNNRNLKDFTVDLDNAARLRELIPPSSVFVAESGIASAADAATLRKIGADAVLVGEYLMRSTDKKQAIREMRDAAHDQN